MAEIVHEPEAQNGGNDEEEASGNKLELSVDEIIEDHIGSFGVSQIIQVFLVSLAWIIDAQTTLVTIFSDAQPQWRCVASSSTCSMSKHMCGLDRGAWEWVGGNKSSTIAEWGLICGNKFKAGVPASLFFIGALFGSTALGKLADSYLGRKKTILLSCLLTAITGFLTSLSPNIYVYAFLRFSNGFARSGVGICCLVLASEVVGRRWRGQVGQFGFFLFALGCLSLPLVAYLSRHSWRNIYRILSVFPLIYSILCVPFISESPRWLAIVGRSDEAMQILNKLAKLNGKNLPANLAILVPAASHRNAKTLWSAKWAMKRIVKIMLAGFGIGFAYYGLQLNVGNLNSNLYLTVSVNALMEIPSLFLGSFLLTVMPRRILFISFAFIAGIASLSCTVFAKGKKKLSWPQLTLEVVGFLAASKAFDVLYIYCVELFPTNVRNFTVSLSRFSLMLGAAISPLLVVLGRLSPSLSFITLGSLSIFSAIVAFWLPETKDAPLYETLEEQEEKEKRGSSVQT